MQQNQNRVLANSTHRKVRDSVVRSRRTIINVEDAHQHIGERKRIVQTDTHRQTAREMKEAEIQKAIKKASSETNYQQKRKSHKIRFGIKDLLLALACAAVAVFAVVYFVNLNAPDIVLKVAAMQNGIEARYPNFTPRDYQLSNITSENGKITVNFNNINNDSEVMSGYSIIEERSSWDSNALYNNFVKNEFSEEYTTIKEQGLTIYIDGGDAAWVNGGVFYRLVSSGDMLTKKQIKAIAVSF